MAQGSVRRCRIGALQAGQSEVLVVALVIQRSDPRKVVTRKDGSERWVTGFTLRDSNTDMVNLTVWSSEEEAGRLAAEFRVGMVVELVRPRVQARDLGGREAAFSPQVTSPAQLVFQGGRTMLCPHLGDATDLLNLLNIPSKASSTFLSINDIVTNSGALKGHFVDMLVAVRKVGEERKFVGKAGGGEKGVREVRLFDQTADSLLLKLWESEHRRLADAWLPREHVLFLADARIDWDDWRSSYVLTATSKTVVTVNPSTPEAEALVRYAQVADFSPISRLDQYVASLPPGAFGSVVNVAKLQQMVDVVVGSGEALAAVTVYGFLTRFDLDSAEAVSLRCGRCGGALAAAGEESVCAAFDCRDFNVAPAPSVPSPRYFLRCDVTDETGTMGGLRLSGTFLVNNFGPAAEFSQLSDQTKTAYKWRWFLRPVRVSLALLLPTAESRAFTGMVAGLAPAGLEELCAKMPSPAL